MFINQKHTVTESFLQSLKKVQNPAEDVLSEQVLTEQVLTEEVCEVSSNREMAMGDLYKIHTYAGELYAMLEKQDCELEGWVASKITVASDYLGSVKNYMDHEDFRVLKDRYS
jgi:SMC interacting uncharacterized protein involved in chromosome segregation